jgi:hypothetical protein
MDDPTHLQGNIWISHIGFSLRGSYGSFENRIFYLFQFLGKGRSKDSALKKLKCCRKTDTVESTDKTH